VTAWSGACRCLGTLVPASRFYCGSDMKAQAVGTQDLLPLAAAEGGLDPLDRRLSPLFVDDAQAWPQNQLDTSVLKVSLTSPGRWVAGAGSGALG
jgi:hypothetical protein